MTKSINKIIATIRSTPAETITLGWRCDVATYRASADTVISYADLLALCDEVVRLRAELRHTNKAVQTQSLLSHIQAKAARELNQEIERLRQRVPAGMTNGPMFGKKGVFE